MKHILTKRPALIALFCTLWFSACILVVDEEDHRNRIRIDGSGILVEETRTVADFYGVTLGAVGDLLIEVGEREALRIEGEDNVLPFIETTVRGGMLHIEVDDDVTLRPTRSLRYYLTVPSLDEVVLAGSGRIIAPALSSNTLTVALLGSGEIETFDLEARRLVVQLAGSGQILASGVADRQTVTLSGSGVYEARDLESEEAQVTITGSGTAFVHVYDHLDAIIAGSGTIRYRGTPTVSQVITGSGRVAPLGN